MCLFVFYGLDLKYLYRILKLTFELKTKIRKLNVRILDYECIIFPKTLYIHIMNSKIIFRIENYN